MKNLSWLFLILSLFFAADLSDAGELVQLGGASVCIALGFSLFSIGALYKYHNFISVPGSLPLSFLLALLLLQVVPLPPVVVEVLSPTTFQLYEPLLVESTGGSWITLSTSPKESLQLFFLILASALTYALAQQLFTDREKIKIYALRSMIAITGLTLALWALQLLITEVASVSASECLYLFIPLSFALFLYYIPVTGRDNNLLEEMRLLYKEPGFQSHVIYLGCCIALVVTLVAMYQWTAIIHLYVVAVLFLVFFSLWFTDATRSFIFLLVLLGLPFVFFIPNGDLGGVFWKIVGGGRTLESPGDQLRILLDTSQHFPLFGSGGGSYDKIFPYLLGLSGDVGVAVRQPLSVKLLLELGLLGAGCVGWFFLSFIHNTWKMVRCRQDRFVSLVGISSLAAVIGLLIEGFIFPVKFSLLLSLVLAAFMGFSNSAVHCRFNYYEPVSFRKQIGNYSLVSGIFLSSLFFLSSLAFFSAGWYADYLNRFAQFTGKLEEVSGVQQEVERDHFRAAMRFDPFESSYPFKLGQLESFWGHDERAKELFVKAGIKDVMDGRVFQQLALLRLNSEEERRELMKLGYSRDPLNRTLGMQYAEWLLSNGMYKEAQSLVREAMAFDPDSVIAWFVLLERNSFDYELLSEIFPDSVPIWLNLARESERRGDSDAADFLYQGALALIGSGNYTDPVWFQEIIAYYKRQDREEMTLLVMRRAITLLPEPSIFHRMLGDYYRREGVRYRAIEEYEEALKSNPADKVSKASLQELLGTE